MAKKLKIGAAAAGPSYAGVDLTAPAVPQYPKFTGTPSAPNIINAVQQAQNQANQANQQRYTQGLGVLSNTGNSSNQFAAQGQQQLGSGEQSAQGYIQQAINNSQQFGQSALGQVQRNLQAAQGQSAQSAISRGLGNTTVLDSLQAQNQQQANIANQAITEQQANRQSALNLNQAQTAQSFAGQKAAQSNAQGQASRVGGTDIASFIANRGDVQPNLRDYASLVQGASQGGPGKMTSTTVNAPASYTGSLGGGGGYSPRSSASGGYQGGAGGGMSGGSFSGGGGGSSGGLYSGPGTGNLNLGPSGSGGEPSIASAITPKTAGYQPWMGAPDAQTTSNPGGSTAVSATQAAPTGQQYKGQVKSWMDFSGLPDSAAQAFLAGGGKING